MTVSIVVQRHIEVESRLRRLIAVVKVRGSRHSLELREFTIDDTGIGIGNMLPNEEGLLVVGLQKSAALL
jgi:circadian clock protein KaiC